MTVDPGEVSLEAAEREGHAEGRELIAHVDGSPSDLEPWEEELDLAGTHLLHTIVEHASGERLLKVPKPVLPVRKEHEHGQVTATVDHVYRLVAFGLQVPDLLVLVHQRRLHPPTPF